MSFSKLSPTQLNRASFCCALALCVLLTGGCFGSAQSVPGRPEVAKAVGNVTYKGKPLGHAYVTFHSTNSSISGTGETDAQGKFAISTFAKGDGAVLGSHEVTIQVFPEAAVPGVALKQNDAAIPTKYFTREGTPLTAEVKSGENEFAFEVK